MLRCTVEMIPFGIEAKKKTIGLIEIANDGTGNKVHGNYVVAIPRYDEDLGQYPIIHGDNVKDLRSGKCRDTLITGRILGFERTKGCYALLHHAIQSCHVSGPLWL